MTSKTEPWVDDFSDGVVTDDGLGANGAWSVVNGAAQNAWITTLTSYLSLPVNDDDLEYRYTYSLVSSTAATRSRKASSSFRWIRRAGPPTLSN